MLLIRVLKTVAGNFCCLGMHQQIHQQSLHQRRKLGFPKGKVNLRFRGQQVQAAAGGAHGEAAIHRHQLYPVHQTQRQDDRAQI